MDQKRRQRTLGALLTRNVYACTNLRMYQLMHAPATPNAHADI